MMPAGPSPNEQRLRTLFERRDELASDLAAVDVLINQAIRDICKEHGLSFMRVEAARQLVCGIKESACG